MSSQLPLPPQPDVELSKTEEVPDATSVVPHSTLIGRLFVHPLFWVVCFALGYQSVYYAYLSPKPILYPDSYSYLDNSAPIIGQLCQGKVDPLRTPLYPCCISAIRFCFGEESLHRNITIFQQLVFFISVLFFYALLSRLLKNKLVVALATLYYACFPPFLSFNTAVLTESLSISGTVFLVWIVVEYTCRPGFIKAALAGGMVFLLIMLRPSFLPVLPILWFFWGGRILFCRESRAKEFTGLVATTTSLCLLLGYCQLFKQQYGFFAPSVVSHVNQLHILIQSGIYIEGSDPEMNRLIQKNIDDFVAANPKAGSEPSWFFSTALPPEAFDYVCWRKLKEYGPHSRYAAYVNETIKRHRWRYAAYSLHKIVGVGPRKLGHVDPFDNKSPQRILLEQRLLNLFGGFLDYNFVYCLLFVDFVVSLTIFLKTRRFSWIFSFLFLCAAGFVLTAVVGGQSDWSRLGMSALPFVLILIARYLDLLVCIWKKIFGEVVLNYFTERL